MKEENEGRKIIRKPGTVKEIKHAEEGLGRVGKEKEGKGMEKEKVRKRGGEKEKGGKQ